MKHLLIAPLLAGFFVAVPSFGSSKYPAGKEFTYNHSHGTTGGCGEEERKKDAPIYAGYQCRSGKARRISRWVVGECYFSDFPSCTQTPDGREICEYTRLYFQDVGARFRCL